MSVQASDSQPQQSIERRATALFQAHQQAIYQRTDRMFVALLGIQWLTGIVFALSISPRVWYGTVNPITPTYSGSLFWNRSKRSGVLMTCSTGRPTVSPLSPESR